MLPQYHPCVVLLLTAWLLTTTRSVCILSQSRWAIIVFMSMLGLHLQLIQMNQKVPDDVANNSIYNL